MKPTGDRREQGFDRLLSREFSQPTATAEACPQAELVSAWFDRALPSAEAAAVESHVANCTRCQDVLGHLARTEPEVLYVHPKTARSPWTWHLRWAAPLAATALVAFLVGAGSLLAPDPGTAVDAPAQAPAVQAQASPSADVALDAAKENVIAPQASGGTGGAALPGAKKPPAAPPADARTRPTSAPQEEGRMARSKIEAPPAPPAPAQAPARNFAADAAVQSRAVGEAKGAGEGAAGRAGNEAKAADVGRGEKLAAVPQLPGLAETFVVPVPKEPAPVSARRAVVALESAARAEPSAFVPGSPVGWRHARPGSVMRTLDGGTTWSEQALPGNVRLLALSAVSSSICWAAGASGALLRTTDGVTWETVAAPAAVDLAWIAALDERRATVRTADGVTYDTGDGGATWRRR